MSDILGELLGGGSKQGGGGANPMLTMLLPLIGSMLAGGGLQKLLAQFQAKGMDGQAASWVGAGANEPVSAAQVRDVLGDDKVAEIAQQAGISTEEAADGLAQVLPQVVDKASPAGELLPQGELDSAFEQLQQPATAR